VKLYNANQPVIIYDTEGRSNVKQHESKTIPARAKILPNLLILKKEISSVESISMVICGILHWIASCTCRGSVIEMASSHIYLTGAI
jgi:dihydrodipicolinate synthase/N-acetylneuraminate lyase